MVIYSRFSSPFGILQIGTNSDAVVSIRLSSDASHCEHSPLTDLVIQQLGEYCRGKRRSFDFPIRFEGTDFQKAVWDQLMQIPYGEVRTYGQIASAIGNPKAVRAVGMACNRNPLWIVIPCHRVVGQNRKLTGYAGGLTMKQFLLDLEETNR